MGTVNAAIERASQMLQRLSADIKSIRLHALALATTAHAPYLCVVVFSEFPPTWI